MITVIPVPNFMINRGEKSVVGHIGGYLPGLPGWKRAGSTVAEWRPATTLLDSAP
jgi:hypothetical protein